MEEKQLDFKTTSLCEETCRCPASASASVLRASDREGRTGSSPPVYKTEFKSGPVRNPGAAPFAWEQIPGRPKVGSLFDSSSPERQAPAQRLPPSKLSPKRENVKSAENKDSPEPVRRLPPGRVVDSRKEIVKTLGRQIGKVGTLPNDRTVGGGHDSAPDSSVKSHGGYGSNEDREKMDGECSRDSIIWNVLF
ncbi:hypothetical protein EJ110_NYTH29466 [Nymphaea thermarum]|nr:hypothetical protein EJ110_NYTH29466 [Nymphaea thermarum]